MGFDDSGWFVGSVLARPLEQAYSILAPDDDSRMEAPRFQPQAARFFAADLRIVTAKSYPAGLPRRDLATIEIGHRGEAPARVELITLPLDEAPALRQAALAAAAAMGGFDALVARSRRLWQVHPPEPEGDPRAALALAAVLASVLLGPILAPDGTTFGVRGARERLARAGWKS